MRYFILVCCCLGLRAAVGQEVLENNPPSIKWYRIKTPNFKVLYTTGFEPQAQQVANTLEHIRVAESRSLGKSPRRISVILQNQTSVSNGFVTITPRRSEFFTMPPQDYNFLGTNDWLDQLAAHEFRHVVQYDNSNTGFNKVLYFMFGPATLSAMSLVAVPQWFWEGDAVATETAFTHSGRGRIPNFDLLLRTNLLEGRSFNYHKQYLRSYKHNISDHYVLGYHMVSYLRKRTGDPDIWEKITKRAWSVPFIPFTFSNALKKESGLYVTGLYKAMADDLIKTWRDENSLHQVTPFTSITTHSPKAYTSYSYPQELSDGSLLMLKNGIGDIVQLVVLTNGKEKTVFTPGMWNDAGMLSVAGTKVVWAEFGFDPRWRARNYSQLKSYDIKTSEYKIITRKSRFSAAALSPDGRRVATVESKPDYSVAVVVLEAEFGNEIKRFSNRDQALYSMPRWSTDGKKIVVLKTKDGYRSVVMIDYDSGIETELITPSRENIGHPVLTGNYLFYNSPASGIDNIYALDLQQQKQFQVTSSKYGAYNPSLSADGKRIYYNEQTRDGLSAVYIPFDPSSWRSLEKLIVKKYDQYVTEQEGRPTLFDSIPQKDFESSRYSKLSGIINPYSWGAYFTSNYTQADIGFNSQDILSTTSIKAGYLLDLYERTGAWHVGFSYQNWYPIIDVDFLYAKRSTNEGDIVYDRVVGTDTTENVVENLSFKWTEKTIEAGVRLPLITTNSRYHGSFSVSNYIGITQVSDFENSIDGGGRVIPANYPQYFLRDYLDNGTLRYNRFQLSATRLLKQSRRDINSKFGQILNLTWYSTPYRGDFSANQFSLYSYLYFPGLFKHHSFWGHWAFQSTFLPIARSTGEGLDNYLFNNQIPLPRGLSSYIPRFEEFYSMSANYTLPLWYPDIALGPILNVQRFRGNAFFDYGFGSTITTLQTFKQSYISVGGELRMDFNIFRFLPQFNVGVRYAYGIKPSVTNLELLIGLVNF